MIFREDDLADRVYLIETGKVILESSGGVDDPMLGWSWMFPSHTWNFTARAVEATTAIFFSGTILREYCEKDHSFGYELLKRMSSVMYQWRQAARNKMLTIRHRSGTLQPIGALPVDGGAGTRSLEAYAWQVSTTRNAHDLASAAEHASSRDHKVAA